MFCVPMELPIRRPTALSEPAVRCSRVADTDCVRVPIEAPILAVVPELMRLPELAAGSLAPAEPRVLFVLTELPMRRPDRPPKPPVDLLVVADTDCVCSPIELPIRAVLLELIPPPELAGSLAPAEPGVLFVLIELPIRKPIPLLEPVEVNCFPAPDTDGIRPPIEAPIRPVLLELMRAVEFPIVGVPGLELVPVDVPLVMEPAEGCRMLSPMLDRELVIRPDVNPLGVRLVGALLG